MRNSKKRLFADLKLLEIICMFIIQNIKRCY